MSVDTDQRLRPVTLGRVFERVRDTVVPRLRSAVDRLPASMRDVVGYHFGWCDELGRPANGRSGELIRPALTLLSAHPVGAGQDRVVDPAASRQPVYNFPVLHYEVMVGALTRRHR